MPSLVIADDHMIVREGVKQLLAQRGDLQLVAEASNGLEAITALKRFKPDVLLLDVSMPYANALEVFLEARRWSPDSKVVVFTGVNSHSQIAELINAGVHGMVLKHAESDDVCKALSAVLAGQRYLPADVAALTASATALDQLTPREKQVLQLIVTGNTNAQIARLLSISPKTVDKHRTSLMKTLGVHSVSELMAFALREGLLPGDASAKSE